LAEIQPQDRQQISFGSLEEFIDSNHPVRFVDAFVEHLDLTQLQFSVKAISVEGRPGFNPKVFLKLYLYGYLNGIRSSRALAKECVRNIEVQWLLGKLCPNYHSIADFRKDNAKALKNTFKLYVLFLKETDLIGGEVVAIDGTKFRASNSKKNNYNQKKIDRHLAYIESKTSEYLQVLASNDEEEREDNQGGDIAEKIARLKANQLKYEALQEQLNASDAPQISTTDSDARALLIQGQVVEVSYNQQAAVDQKHNLVVATHTLNRNDRNALSRIAIEAQTNIEADNLTVVLDKGYHNGRELQVTQSNGINTIVAMSETVNSNKHGTTPDYLVTKFKYDAQTDTYTCPQSEVLRTVGTWHKKSRERDSHLYKKYRTPGCKSCPVKSLCTGKATGGREIERSEYAEAVEKNANNYRNNQVLYRKRQEINEHIFGTIKRQWNFYYTNLRGLEKVDGEMSLVMMVYNIKRSMNLLGIEKLLAGLCNWQPDYVKACFFAFNRLKISLFNPFKILEQYKIA
jgi:transposase